MDTRELEQRSSAVTLSDMEVFIFPELMYSLVLANLMSPRIWRWRDDPWFAGLKRMNTYRRIQRLKQYIIDHYVFNLDLDTWGLTTQPRELARFQAFLDPATLAQSNALFGYEGDKHYFDIGIRTHFGLDKYTADTIPYWKTETVEAMDAFVHRPGYTTGAGECVSLAALYAAALHVVAGVPLRDIFLMATPLHSQNFVDTDEGLLINNRRLVTRNMWFNGSALSGQARRALENERVTIVSHVTGHIHTVFGQATIDPAAYERFSRKLTAFLKTDLSPEMLGNFLRQSPGCQKCFVMRWPLNGSDRYVPLDRVFAYEQNSSSRLTDGTRARLMGEIAQEEFACAHCPGKLVFNDVEDYIRSHTIDLGRPEDVAALKQQVACGCLSGLSAIDDLITFCHVQPRLPDAGRVKFQPEAAPIGIDGCTSAEAVLTHLEGLRGGNRTVDLAFYTFRDLSRTEALPFLLAALQRSPVALTGAAAMSEEEVVCWAGGLANESIYDGPSRLAQPDEVWNFRRGDGLERALAVAMILRERRRDPSMTITVEGGQAALRQAGRIVCSFPSAKQPRETTWDLSGIALRTCA
ncbi:MAG: hypothetical protein WCI17_12085 [bacterium]